MQNKASQIPVVGKLWTSGQTHTHTRAHATLAHTHPIGI